MAVKITIIVIGKVKERYIQEGIAEFEKRLTRFCKLNIIELKEGTLQEEAEKLEKYLGPNTYLLDEKGKEYVSLEFAELIKKTDQELIFIIGNHHGVADQLKKKAKLISLSRLTFTHELCRLFLVEQIYRGFAILNNIPYHK
jgi:23S rRNA (pseudouridine1915-N3)-methyltransferase